MSSVVSELLPQQLQRFWSYVQKSDGCWEWGGPITYKGYGVIGFWQKTYPAHRVSFELHNGPIPDGLVIDHVCRKRNCVNPAHLRAVTPRVNSLENSESFSALNARKTHCPRGHEYAAGNMSRTSNGGRYCLACKREKWQPREGSRGRPGDRTECPKGHPYSGANLIVTKHGRECRECQRDRGRRSYHRNKGKRAAELQSEAVG